MTFASSPVIKHFVAKRLFFNEYALYVHLHSFMSAYNTVWENFPHLMSKGDPSRDPRDPVAL